LKWHDDGLEDGQKMSAATVAEDLQDSTQPKEKARMET